MGILLAELRAKAGLAQQGELARLVRSTQQTVSRWELGISRPRDTQIAAVAKALNVDAAVLMRAAGYTTPKSVATFDQPFPIDALQPETFERFCLYFLSAVHPTAKVNRMGGQGHAQDGLDISVVFKDGTTYTYQCKRVSQFGPEKVRAAVKAHKRPAKKIFLLLTKVATPRARRALEGNHKWDLWDKEDISRIIRQELSPAEQQRLVDTFFRGQRLALLGENEPGPWQSAKDFFAPFEGRHRAFSHDWALTGRESEVAQLLGHLTDPCMLVMFLEGAGGSGKSRVLKHVTEKFEKQRTGVRIHFLTPNEEATRKSLEELGDGPKLLVVDDAHDRANLQVLFQFAAVGSNNARLLIALRPYGMGYLRSQASNFALGGPSVATTTLPRLGLADTTRLIKQVLSEFNGPLAIADNIARYTLDCPLAAVIGAQIVAKEKRSYEFAKNEDEFRHTLLGKFRDILAGELGNKSDADPIKKILRIIALLQPFYLEDEGLIKAIGSVEGLDAAHANRLIRLLNEAGVLFKRGGTYRLSPDLLADHVIEEVCIGNEGRSTGYAERVFEAAGANHLEHLLVNLGRLDWSRTNGDPSNSRLLDGIWGEIQATPETAQAYLPAVTAVAYYQPKRALDLVEGQIRAGASASDLANVAKYVAFDLRYLRPACECLWELGKEDSRALHQHPGHAVRVLAELCAVEPNKPIAYNESVVDFALSLFDKESAWSGAYTPFDILKGVLSTEGHTTTSSGRALQIGRFLVNRKFVQSLREKVVDATLGLLDHPNLVVSVKAAAFLADALRYPIGMANVKVAASNAEEWTSEFVSTIQKTKKAVETKALDPLVLVGLLRSVSWHNNYRDKGETGVAAAELIASIPNSLEFKALCGFTDGWGHHFARFNPETYERDWQGHMDAVTKDLIAAYPNGKALWKFIEGTLRKLQSVRSPGHDGSHILYGNLIAASSEFAEETIRRALANPEGPTARFDAWALSALMTSNRKRGTEFAQEFVKTGTPSLVAAAARAYAGCISRSWRPDEMDLAVIKTFFRSKELWVVRNAVEIARAVSAFDPHLAVDLLKLVDFGNALDAMDDAFVLFSKDAIPFELLPSEDIDHFLGQLIDVPELDGYWTEVFLAQCSRHHALRTARFFMDRVERATAARDWGFRPVNFGPYVHTPLKFKESEHFPVLLKSVWQWMKERSTPKEYIFNEFAGHLFSAMFGPIDGEMVSALEKWAEAGTEEDMASIAMILREASHEFVFSQRSFVIRLLERAAKLGEKSRENVLGGLYASAFSGGYSGVVGEPMPRDLQTKKDCEEILKGLSRFAPAHSLYDGLLKHAEQSIARSLKDAEQFEN